MMTLAGGYSRITDNFAIKLWVYLPKQTAHKDDFLKILTIFRQKVYE